MKYRAGGGAMRLDWRFAVDAQARTARRAPAIDALPGLGLNSAIIPPASLFCCVGRIFGRVGNRAPSALGDPAEEIEADLRRLQSVPGEGRFLLHEELADARGERRRQYSTPVEPPGPDLDGIEAQGEVR